VELNRRILFTGLVLSIILSDSIIFLATDKSRDFYSNWIININSAIAAALAIFIVFRQKFRTLHGKAHAALAIGLSLWLCAEIIWAMYEIVWQIVAPVPSVADYLWLSAYGFLAYYLFATYKEFNKKFRFSKKVLIASIIGGVIFVTYIIGVTTSLSVLSTHRSLAMFGVMIAYPTLDAILMVPAIVILLDIRKEPLWFTPWICESLGLLLIVLSDSWFALVVLTSLTEQFWLSSLFFAAHLLVMAAGLVWYIKYLTLHHYEYEQQPQQQRKMTNSDTRLHNGHSNMIVPPPAVSEKRKKRIPIGTIICMVLILFAGFVVYFIYPRIFSFGNANIEIIPASASSKHTIILGALLSLSGASATLGESEEAGLKVALRDVNESFKKTHTNLGVGLIIEDTHTNPAFGIKELKDLASKGIRIVIGPSTSAELEAIKDYANNNGIILLSPSSTAPLLATSGDNIFRLVPDDTHQAEAIATQMRKDGIRVVIPMWRADVYGDRLVNSTKGDFQMLGGTVVDGVGYAPPVGHFSASLDRINLVLWDQQLKSLDSKVTQAISRYGTEKVGVYIVAFDEVVPIFIQAQDLPSLSKVRWYGSDGSVLNSGLIRNVEAAKFAAKTSFLNPIYAIRVSHNNKTNLVESEIQNMIARIPRSYASVAYDSLWIAALTENASRATNDINTLTKTLVQTANSYTGITGNTTLNEAGDRKYASYDFWGVRDNNGVFTWEPVNRYYQGNVTNNYEIVQEATPTNH
jgi:branched-chain amino acid transport system substrate-binding protein